MINKYKGLLFLTDNKKELTYVLINKKLNKSFNLTNYLRNNQGKEIGLVVNIYGTDVFCEVGKIEIISEVIMVNGRDISSVLWGYTKDDYHEGTLLQIIIDNMEEES